jgi:methyltransferase (TIGR00027 family)
MPMSLPNSSYLVSVGELRYIQGLCEPADSRNPDALVGAFLSLRQRLRCLVRGALFLRRLRADPFYHYLVARTRYYDQLFLDAVRDSVACIVNIGCGTDTRAYRFAHLLAPKGITVLECDQPQVIDAKRDIATRRFPTGHVRYVPLELHDAGWSGFAAALDAAPPGRAFVMMEGVSPYVDRPQFEAFLRLLAARLRPGSVLAYDFKREGVADDFGRSAAAPQPFRLPGERDAVATYHHALGFQLQHLETSASLTRRLLPRASRLDQEDSLAWLTC